MTKVYYHGTSADNLQAILENGLSCKEPKLWADSRDAVYLWDVERLAEAEGEDNETQERKEANAFRYASESGQVALCTSTDCRIVVLRIEMDDAEIYPDDSSENMMDCGAMCSLDDIPVESITEIKISNDLSLLRGYFISLLLNRGNSNIEFTSLERLIASSFKGAEIYPEHIEDATEWEIVPINITVKS